MDAMKFEREVTRLLDVDAIDEAIGLMNGEVRSNPADVDRRARLAELLCFAGNFERADTILDSIAGLDPATAVGVALFRQLVRAARARGQFYTEGRVPEFLATPDPICALELRAAVLLREGAVQEAAALLETRDNQRSALAGVADSAAFDDFRDLDDVAAGHFEILTSTGKYYWVPTSAVLNLEFRKPERRRDLLWPRLHLSVAGGPEGEVFMPAIYASANSTVAQRLGHITDFEGGDGSPTAGLGLRSFLVGDECKTILELAAIEFSTASLRG